MRENLVNALRVRRPHVRARWEDLLRIERASSPLANPDALVHLLEWTLDEIFLALANPLSVKRGRHEKTDYRHECPCGRNPLLAYFAAGEQALREALVMAQASSPGLEASERDASLEQLDLEFQRIARREIEAFCGVCQYRLEPPRPTAVVAPNETALAAQPANP